MSVVQSENHPHDIDVPVLAEINIAKISGKCGILNGEIVSPVEIARYSRYGTPHHVNTRIGCEHTMPFSIPR